MRSREETTLGPQYHGSRISRSALLEEESDGDLSTTTSSRESAGSYEATEAGKAVEAEDQSGEDNDNDKAFGRGTKGDNDHLMVNGGPSALLSNGRAMPRGTITKSENGAEQKKPTTGDSDDEFNGFSDTGNEEDAEDGMDSVTWTSETGQDDDEGDEEDEDNEDEEGDDLELNVVDQREQRSAQRAELRKMMNEEQKAVITRVAEATRADADKGRAVRHQRKAYDTLLNTRIRLQKGLIAMNTLSAAPTSDITGSQQMDEIYLTAEASALNLWNQLSQLRRDLQAVVLPSKAPNNKRKFEEFDSSASLDKLWSEMEEQEAIARPYRQASLEKWSAKVRGVTNLSLGKRLNNTANQATITDVLNEHLSNMERLVKRTRVPRSCAPIQAQNGLHEAPEIYDDADFYQLQLKELVDQRLADSGTSSMMPALNQVVAMREAKTKKKVDTKASKGRKLRYTVHEKLQNFMAPEDRGSWGVRQIDELFGSLLGARVRLEEDGENDMMDDGDDLDDVAGEGLKLFRS